jgi:ABC-type transport system involved in Fe-S cluster assembly fused permease/ATPase subunit
MNIGLILLIVALSAGLTSGYTNRVIAREENGIEILNTQNIFRSITGTIGFFALIAVIIWGFINLTWWWVVLAFLGVSLFIVPVLFGGRERISIMLGIQPVFDIVCIGLAIYLWVVL